MRSTPNQTHFHPREKFSTGCAIRKRSVVDVTSLTVSEFSDQGTKGVSVKEGGNVKEGREGSRGEKHFPADQVLIGGSSLGIYLGTHFQ